MGTETTQEYSLFMTTLSSIQPQKDSKHKAYWAAAIDMILEPATPMAPGQKAWSPAQSTAQTGGADLIDPGLHHMYEKQGKHHSTAIPIFTKLT